MAANACNRCGCAFGQCECLEASDEVPFNKTREGYANRITRVYELKESQRKEESFILKGPLW